MKGGYPDAGKPGTAGTERRKAPVYPAFLFRCAADWRSALTVQTVTRKGLAGAAHVKGGFKGWCEASGPVVTDEQ